MRDQVLRRTALLALVASAAGCGGGSTGPGASTTITLHGPTVSIAGGADSTVCSFIHLPNTDSAAIKSWQITVPAGVASAALIFTATDAQPVGTVTNSNCDPLGSGATVGGLILEARSTTTLQFPQDDGAGKPVASVVPAHQSAILRIRYVNPGSSAISPALTYTATEYPAGTTVTEAAPFETMNGQINVAPSTTALVSDSCPTPAGAKFFRLTVFTHIHATPFSINDGATQLYSGTDVLAPGATTALTAPFITFSSGRLTTSCTINNPTGGVISSGSSFVTNENCIAATWYFPSDGAKFCLDGNVVSLSTAARRPVSD